MYAQINLKTKLINTEVVGGFWTKDCDYGEDYYFANISFSKLNYNLNRFIQHEHKVNLFLGSSCIEDFYNVIKENASYISMLLDYRDNIKWDIVKCAFLLEEQTKHIFKERFEAKQKRKEQIVKND